MVRLVIAFLCAAAACMLVAGALSSAQTANPTPDPFVAQITHTQAGTGTKPIGAFAGDITANGRFVVIESEGDIATEKTATRNNQDGNRELFIYDYAQRRVFQITDTKSVLSPSPSPSASPSPSPSPSPTGSPSPSPSPTASPTPLPVEPSTVAIEISNNRPMISLEPAVVSGQRVFTIVFSSNAPVRPASFDGIDTGGTLAADGNQEVWTYQLPGVTDIDLSTGAEIPFRI